MMSRTGWKILPRRCRPIFFMCDVQETFRPVIHNMDQVIATSKFMTNVAGALDIPVITTEQLPFKPTVSEIDLNQSHVRLFKKTRFSMLTDEVVKEWEHAHNDNNHNTSNADDIKHNNDNDGAGNHKVIFLYGIEAHVCILQTTLELLERGDTTVYLISDGISSQREDDRETALRRMEAAGAILTTAESAVYEIMKDAKHPKFKACLPHVKVLGRDKRRILAEEKEKSKL